MRLIRLLKNDLAREVGGWVDDKIISHDQAVKICAGYGLDFDNLSQKSYGYFVLIGMGYLFLGLSILTLVGGNWEDIPRAVRMGGLIGLTLLTHLGAVYRYQQGKDAAAITLFFLGSIFYGASIMLIAQIYHLGEHYPDGILWWAIGILPLAVLLRSLLLTLLMMVLAFTWFFTETMLGFYPLLFPLFLLALGYVLWAGNKSLLLFLAGVAGVGLWLEYNLSWLMSVELGFQHGGENVVFAFGFFILLHGLTKWLSVQSSHTLADYGAVLSLWVLRFTLLTLLIFSFEGMWDELVRADWEYPAATILLHLGMCAIGVLLAWRSGKSVMSVSIASVATMALVIVVTTTPTRSYAVLLQVLDNIALIVTGVWLIIRGIQQGISQYFYAGVVTIMLTGFLRYIDLIGDYIGAAVLFIVFALILLSAAKYWRMHDKKQEAMA